MLSDLLSNASYRSAIEAEACDGENLAIEELATSPNGATLVIDKLQCRVCRNWIKGAKIDFVKRHTGVIEKVVDVLSRHDEVDIAVLYGSFAKGTEKPTSDVDLGLGGQKPFTDEQLVELQTQLSNASGREIDLIDLQVASGTVFKEALTTGTILIKREDSVFADILKRLLFEQADFEPLRNFITETNRKRVLG